ncbi:hypothetical protein [Rhabdothermincola salaria]|uniref:hypothetical protein n=1 Tax=Rhabdothermincola salaria TaxID=2903142 RepID=UPI001E35F02D|nr:hypothetical protein [Rhabdothermincola salaria]MCD9625363.1 hypothetical protein [Rhabdothermincola salaria]
MTTAPRRRAATPASAKAPPASDRSPGSWADRLVSGEPIGGPRGRLGVVWFLVALVATIGGLVPLAVLFALVAGAAGLQTAAAWRRVHRRPVQLASGLVGAALPLAAGFGIAFVGLVALLSVVACLVTAVLFTRGRPRRGRPVVLAVAGVTLRSGFFTGVGAAAAVLVARTDTVSFVVLLVLVSAYEAGDYLVGTGASTPIEGPLSGMAAVAVLTFALSVFQLGPFDSQAAWVFGGMVAAAAPLGTFLGSALVPSAAAGGPGLRRLDAWLVAGPAWAWMLWGYLG